MQQITKVQRFTQAFQLTAAIMIAIRAGIRLRAEVERMVHEVAERHETPEGAVNPFDTSGLAAMVKRMQDNLNKAVQNAAREAEGRD